MLCGSRTGWIDEKNLEDTSLQSSFISSTAAAHQQS